MAKSVVGVLDELQKSVAQLCTLLGALPEVDAEDNGKVLMVVEGEWAVADIPSQLPAITAVTDDGKVLTADDGVWVAAALPSSDDT